MKDGSPRILPSRRRIIWRAAFLLIALLLIAQSLRVINLDQQQRVEQAETESLLSEARRRMQPGPLVAESAGSALQRRAPQGWGDAAAIARRLSDDLRDHPELIPAEPVLGGTMGFRPDDIHVLNDRWVLAGYEDGHIAGWGLYAFSFGEDGRVEWRLVESSAE